MKARNLIIPIIVVAFALCGCSQQYEKDLRSAYKDAKIISLFSKNVSNEISSTWRSAIFDHRYTYGNKSEYISDFNDALTMLMKEPSIKAFNWGIDSLRTSLKVTMEKLNNPPSKYKNTYDDMVIVYSNLSELSKMATNPSGSLQTYQQSLHELVSKLNTKFNEIEIRNPEFEK